ncbi:Na+/H+ antiporter subunit A [Kocuria sp. SM24M-10]|uniref:Na+/H+ antiporter subunit A n=1 Tax=Kocuria sp. SM24M-10 TaxID=1660349 RepID=UPI00064AE02E|nr:Na+/H+ antiporter subunit A [Kocuria sp. SM24M-10]KLU08779.1 monovalent cation/H+ antiporter subunit A [Kocuria sp. SM24M-10]
MTVVLLLHAVVATVAPLLFARMGRSAFYLLAAVPLAGFLWLLFSAPRVYGPDGGWTEAVEWIPSLGLDLALRMDALAWTMSLLVLGAGSLVLFYCARYFKPGAGDLGGFGAQLLAFAGAMFGLVTADDMLVLFVFWEITTVLSFLLISYSRARLSARRAALQALVLTTAGGLSMLVGIVMLGQAAGTYRISEVLAAAPELAQRGTVVDVAVFLLLVGAVTKSALIPLHFWLPAAMAAPTPVSAYLHAAAMVKAGVYLVARFAPGYAETALWQPTVMILGLGTMIFGGWAALKQYDLKLVLAYGTVSQLGFLVVVVGRGAADTAQAGMAMLLAHGLFKATLFLVVGIIDHRAGTRDIRRLSGLARRVPVLFAVSAVAAASMAGLPPLAGFVAKESVLAAFTHETDSAAGVVVLAGLVLGSVLTFAYSARFLWGGFAQKSAEFSELDAGADGKAVISDMERVEPGFLAAPLVLAVLTVAYGLWPQPVTAMLQPYVDQFPDPGGHEFYLALWHGLTPALGLSAVIVAGGLLMFLARRPVADLQRALPSLPPGELLYRRTINVLDLVAVWITGRTQRGSLMFYLSVILVTAIVVPLVALVVEETPPLGTLRLSDGPAQLIAGAAMVVAALLVPLAKKRFLAVLLVSVTGYGLALMFALQGAPDLALTQTLVETILLVAFVLALRSLPAPLWHRNPAGRRLLRGTIAVAFGLFMMALAAFSISSRTAEPISLQLPRMAYELGDGQNVVNVILVDIRAWDTFGEISVLVLAATGVASLIFVTGRGDRIVRSGDDPNTEQLRILRRRSAAAVVPSGAELDAVVDRRTPEDPEDPYLLAGRTLAPERRSIVFEVVTRLLFHTFMMVSLYLLIAGHNDPGGGFSGGLMAGLALTVRYLAGGRFELERATPINAGTMLGTGLALAALYALTPVFLGGSVMQSYTVEVELPVFGHEKFVSALVFDIAVYLIVVGLVLDILRSLGGRIDERIEEDAVRRRRRTPGRGTRIRVTRQRRVTAGSSVATSATSPTPVTTAGAGPDEGNEHR